MATFGYGRVSTPELTSENQRLELDTCGHKLDYWFADTCSGRVPAAKRPKFAEMLVKIRDGETLVVAKLDRLGRSIVDVLSTLETLRARNIRVVVVQMGGVDLTSTAGKMITAVLAAVAEMERDLIVERTIAGQARARAEGKRIGRPAVVTEAQRAAIKARVDAGASPTDLAREYGISRALVYLIRDGRPNGMAPASSARVK